MMNKDTCYRIKFRNGFFYPQRLLFKIWVQVWGEGGRFGFISYNEAKGAILRRENKKEMKKAWKNKNGIQATFTASDLKENN